LTRSFNSDNNVAG